MSKFPVKAVGISRRWGLIWPRRFAGALQNSPESIKSLELLPELVVGTSTPFRLILRSQRGEKRLDARRASTGIAPPLSSSRNTAGGRFSSRPKGAPQTRQGGVTALGKRSGLFPARCALPERVWEGSENAK